ncbi:MAG: hypothetical protein AABX29_00895 [Nanoarchaeota archaeon]
MDWREFFKVDIKKILLFILLFGLFSLLLTGRGTTCIEGGLVIGFPISFFLKCNDFTKNIFETLSFIIDIVFWYAVTIILIYLYKIIRKK